MRNSPEQVAWLFNMISDKLNKIASAVKNSDAELLGLILRKFKYHRMSGEIGMFMAVAYIPKISSSRQNSRDLFPRFLLSYFCDK